MEDRYGVDSLLEVEGNSELELKSKLVGSNIQTRHIGERRLEVEIGYDSGLNEPNVMITAEIELACSVRSQLKKLGNLAVRYSFRADALASNV
ncbi:hypothetical protein HAX54_028834 [Datura stramonium]|uniref:Uncharacterized protein n=1 Tax=Datura stramonium TaxID=4076 RepID=A0ABS8S9X5_DATST|nr:hypothetical protein [Datura stramonium]